MGTRKGPTPEELAEWEEGRRKLQQRIEENERWLRMRREQRERRRRRLRRLTFGLLGRQQVAGE
jgi:hypothetical protein